MNGQDGGQGRTTTDGATGREAPVPFETEIQVRWSDEDRYGHVNNARLLTLTEEARVRATRAWSGVTPGRDVHRVVRAMESLGLAWSVRDIAVALSAFNVAYPRIRSLLHEADSKQAMVELGHLASSYRTAKGSLDAARLTGPNGYGESRPLEDLGQTMPGCKSEKNRRTELNVQN